MGNQIANAIWNEKVDKQGALGAFGGMLVSAILPAVLAHPSYRIIAAALGFMLGGCVISISCGIASVSIRKNITERLLKSKNGSRKQRRLQRALNKIKNSPHFKQTMSEQLSQSRENIVPPKQADLTVEDNQQQSSVRQCIGSVQKPPNTLTGLESLAQGIDFQI